MREIKHLQEAENSQDAFTCMRNEEKQVVRRSCWCSALRVRSSKAVFMLDVVHAPGVVSVISILACIWANERAALTSAPM